MAQNWGADFERGVRIFLESKGMVNKQKQQEMLDRLHQAQLSQMERQNQPLGPGIIAREMRDVPLGEYGLGTTEQQPTGGINFPQTYENIISHTPRGELQHMIGLVRGLQEAEKPVPPSRFGPEAMNFEKFKAGLKPPGATGAFTIGTTRYDAKGNIIVEGKKPGEGGYETMEEAISSLPAQPGYLVTPYETKTGTWKARYLPQGGNQFIGQSPTGDIITIPNRGTPTPVVTPGPQTGIGPKVMSEDFKKDSTAVNQAGDLISKLEEKWLSLDITDRKSAISRFGEAKTGYNATAKTYVSSRDAFLGNLSRSLAAERGVLTQQDIERIAMALPRLGLNPLNVDSREEGIQKWAMIKSILKSAHERMAQRHQMTPANPTGVTPGSQSSFTKANQMVLKDGTIIQVEE